MPGSAVKRRGDAAAVTAAGREASAPAAGTGQRTREPSCTPATPVTPGLAVRTPGTAPSTAGGGGQTPPDDAAGSSARWVYAVVFLIVVAVVAAVALAGGTGDTTASQRLRQKRLHQFALIEDQLPPNANLPLYMLREPDGRATLLHFVCEAEADCTRVAGLYARVRGSAHHDLTGRETIDAYESVLNSGEACPVISYTLRNGPADNIFVHHLKALRDGGDDHAHLASCTTFVYFTVAPRAALEQHGISLRRDIAMRKAMRLKPFSGVERIHHVFPSIGVPPMRG